MITLRPGLFEIGPFEISPLSRNFFVIKYFPLTAMLNYLTYQVFSIEKNAAFEIEDNENQCFLPINIKIPLTISTQKEAICTCI